MPTTDAASTFPRRSDLNRMTPAEKAILSAQHAVEAAPGASTRLTDATMLLSQARDAVADHVEGIEKREVLDVVATIGDPIGQFFAYSHLPPHLQERSKPFGDLAALIATTLPRNPERTVALRKLLEAKDAAVRAALFKSDFGA